MMLPVDVSEMPPEPVSEAPVRQLSANFAEDRIEIALKNGRHLFPPMGTDLKQLGWLVAMLEKA